MLTRMKELATQAINGTYSAADRANLNLEFKQLSNEITRISENTFFNGINVINSTAQLASRLVIQLQIRSAQHCSVWVRPILVRHHQQLRQSATRTMDDAFYTSEAIAMVIIQMVNASKIVGG